MRDLEAEQVAGAAPAAGRLPRIDCHIHLAGDGTAGSGCLLTRRMRRRLVTRILQRSLGLPAGTLGMDGDARFRGLILGWLESAREIDLGLLLAFDRPYGDDGLPDERRLELYIPNDYVLDLARRHPRVLAGVSIHPYRPDALDELERCAAAGAAAVKWISVSQNIDPRDRRCLPFYDRLAALGLPLVCHTGPEHAFSVPRPDLQDPALLRPALERGVTVLASHCGLNVLPWERSFLDSFLGLLECHPNLYGDVSGFCLPRRPALVRRLLAHDLARSRLVQGSDWPIPIRAWWLRGLLPWAEALRLDGERNPLDRDVRIKRALGLPEAAFTRGAALFPARVLDGKGGSQR